MNYSNTVLSNGLRVLTVPMSQMPSATVSVWVKTGSRNENKKVNGISHFLEHMTFKGSRKRPSARAISEIVDSFGGEFNAATSKDWTNFYIKARVGNLETAFNVLSDMVINPILKPDDIEREKGVIVEEINMYEDTPQRRIGDIFEQLIFDGYKLGWDIAGVESSVRAITRQDFLDYRQAYYYPGNMLVTVAGGIKQTEVLRLTKKYFGDLEQRPTSEAKFDNFVVSQTKPKVRLHAKKKDQAHFILGFVGSGRDYSGRYAEALLTTILGGGMSSRLFSEVREKRGLAYSVSSGVERYAETGYLYTYAGVDVKRVDQAIAVTLKEHYGIANGQLPISNKELNKAKEYLKGHLALALEDTGAVSSFFGTDELFLGKVKTPEEIFKLVDKVSLDEVLMEAKKSFVPEKLNLAIIGPYDNESRFKKLIA